MATLGATPSTTEFPTGGGFQVDTDGTLETNLLEFWRLTEAANTRAGVKGIINLEETGTPTWNSAGKVNVGCFENDKTNSIYLSQRSNSVFPSGNDNFTISCWLWHDAATGYPTAVSKLTSSGSQRSFFLFYDQGSSGDFQWTVYHNGSTSKTVESTASTGGSVTTATWYHVVAWHDGDNDEVGIRVNDIADNTAAHTTGIYGSTSPFIIGNTGTNDVGWDGRICDVGLWNKVLSAQEITDLYNSGSGNTYVN